MGTLDDYIYARARNALDGIAESDRREVYVVSFFVYDEDENPRKPTLTVGYNTESDVAAAREHPLVMDEAEARWCYAWYGEHALTVMFDSEKDQNGAKIRNRAIQMAGYTFQQDDAVATAITTPWFVANTVFAARRLHDRGDIARIFGRSIPVLVHELEYYDAIAMQNLAANPCGVAAEFVQWIRAMASPSEVDEADIP